VTLNTYSQSSNSTKQCADQQLYFLLVLGSNHYQITSGNRSHTNHKHKSNCSTMIYQYAADILILLTEKKHLTSGKHVPQLQVSYSQPNDWCLVQLWQGRTWNWQCVSQLAEYFRLLAASTACCITRLLFSLFRIPVHNRKKCHSGKITILAQQQICLTKFLWWIRAFHNSWNR